MPSLDFMDRSQYVLVSVSGAVTTTLTCDIQPGAAPESYDVVWFRYNTDGSFTRISDGISQETYSLTVEVNLIHDNTLYRCSVYIDHDGVGTGSSPKPYDGAHITLFTAGTLAYMHHTIILCMS